MAEKDSSLPERIGGHEIVDRLGEGPRGVVYLGRESEEAARVAIKTLQADPADPGFAGRLKSVAKVSSSYVARTIDAGTEDGLSYVVREHVEGRSLAETVAADGPLSGDSLERVAVGMLTALTAVHLAGFAHRGLTPSNVILTGEGLRVTDIEIGDPVGEIGYRAPEQINGLRYGPYADVFAWAATVVFAATGSAPFGQDAESVLNGEPEVGELPEPLRQVVLAALAKDVSGRPTTYTALLRLLGDSKAPMPASAIEGVPVPPPTLIGGQPLPVPPGVLPIQLSIEGAQTPMMPPQGPMAPMQQGPMQAGPADQPPIQPGPVDSSPMAQGPMVQGPMAQGPVDNGGVPPQIWGPPPGSQSQPQGWTPTVVPGGQGGGQPRKPFPVGLVAGVTAVVLLSGLGLWGASAYSNKVTFAPAAAASGEPTNQANQQGDAFAAQGSTSVAPTQPQAVVTAPWATTPTPYDDNGVGPMTLPSDDPTAGPQLPVIPTAPTPTLVPTQPVPIPTVTTTAQPTQAQPTQTQQPTATGKPTKTRKARPTATVTKTVPPSPTPTQSPTQEPTKEPTKEPTREPEPTPTRTTQRPTQRPTPTKTTAKPTPTKTTPKPTPTKTTPRPTPTKTTPKPTPTKTTPPPSKPNPYTATQVCGGGFVVQRSSSFSGGTTYQLWNNSTGQNCVVTLKSGPNVGKATPVSATLEVKGGGSQTDSGNFEYYAGPVKLPAKGKCVKYSGSAGSGSTSVDWSNCG
ncbi:serine/threonine protein kinase [Nonomuraea sp. NPDC049400]|uniref:serine/threonine protein kinase n=1 Tax=Nonomuraea sp. NPDC049400 TaxID=3364352 RepID=UPI00378EF34D